MLSLAICWEQEYKRPAGVPYLLVGYLFARFSSIYVVSFYYPECMVQGATYCSLTNHPLNQNFLHRYLTVLHMCAMKVFERWVESLDVMEYLNSKIDIPLTHRTIDKGNFIVDFAFLEQSYQDVIMGPVVRICRCHHYIQCTCFICRSRPQFTM